MHHSKGVRSGWLPCIFFHRYWSIVKDEVLEVVLGFLNSNMDISEINKTFLCLIAKVKNPIVISD